MMLDQNKKLENMVLTCIDTAKAMLVEYKLIVPFGVRASNANEDLKMNCPGDKLPEADWNEQLDMVVTELKGFVSNEDIFATAVVTELESEGESAIGLQIETELSSVLFVYPFILKDDEWVISEPIETDQLLSRVYG